MMRFFQFIIFLFFSSNVFSAPISTVNDCPNGFYRYQLNYFSPPSCLPMGQMPGNPNQICLHCNQGWQGNLSLNVGFNPFMFPMPMQQQPWWGIQGGMYYPNMYYPGAWQNHGINQSHYSGGGEVSLLKPNIYVKSKKELELEIKFTDKEIELLATTPFLDQDNSLKAKVKDDLFVVDGIEYDYLFYDGRSYLKNFQFQAGVCTKRESLIEMMEEDLKALGHSKKSLNDFKTHWDVKIPRYDYYCLYPQYNQELDKAFPVKLSQDASFSRSLYIVVPYETLELKNKDVFPPLPTKDFQKIRPSLVASDLELREWGVAFLFDFSIKR